VFKKRKIYFLLKYATKFDNFKISGTDSVTVLYTKTPRKNPKVNEKIRKQKFCVPNILSVPLIPNFNFLRNFGVIILSF